MRKRPILSFILGLIFGSALQLQLLSGTESNNSLEDSTFESQFQWVRFTNSILPPKTEPRLKIGPQRGTSSIFVEALQILSNQKRYSNPSRTFFDRFLDTNSGRRVRPSTALNAFIQCSDEFSKLPRSIDEQTDYKVRIVDNKTFQQLFYKQHETVFGYNLLIEENLGPNDNKSRQARARKRLYNNYKLDAVEYLRTRLFENPFTAKIENCRYRDYRGKVIIYYDILTDLFAVVGQDYENFNELLEYGISSNLDYIDIFNFKSIFTGDTTQKALVEINTELIDLSTIKLSVDNQSQSSKIFLECPSDNSPALVFLPEPTGFDRETDVGLPQNYDPGKGWWLDRQNEILKMVNKDNQFNILRYEITATGPTQNDTTDIEALTILQAQYYGIIMSPTRPNYGSLNLDFQIEGYNDKIFRIDIVQPTYVDIKSPLDPEVIRNRKEGVQRLEDQVDFLLKNIVKQRNRARTSGHNVIHIIRLLRIKPSQRAYLMDNLRNKALKSGISLDLVYFINTDSSNI